MVFNLSAFFLYGFFIVVAMVFAYTYTIILVAIVQVL